MKIMRAIIFILFLLKISTACSDFLKEESQDEVIVRTTADYSEFLLGSGYPQPAITYPYETLSLLDDDVEVNESRLTSDENSALLSRFPVLGNRMCGNVYRRCTKVIPVLTRELWGAMPCLMGLMMLLALSTSVIGLKRKLWLFGLIYIFN